MHVQPSSLIDNWDLKLGPPGDPNESVQRISQWNFLERPVKCEKMDTNVGPSDFFGAVVAKDASISAQSVSVYTPPTQGMAPPAING